MFLHEIPSKISDVNNFVHSWNNNLLDKLCETQNEKNIFYNSNININFERCW